MLAKLKKGRGALSIEIFSVFRLGAADFSNKSKVFNKKYEVLDLFFLEYGRVTGHQKENKWRILAKKWRFHRNRQILTLG